MKLNQIQAIFTDINSIDIKVDQWFNPTMFSYIVLKDNSILYISEDEMWYFDSTDKLLYVAHAILDTVNKELIMPTNGVDSKDNLDRVSKVIDFENINHVVLRYKGEYLGNRGVR